ncbi:hypothetical protein [Brucella abortus]|uniref:hypothetical protein n=1 Tax=Brucella abortus TaxID=235 RepID=UPI0009AC3D05
MLIVFSLPVSTRAGSPGCQRPYSYGTPAIESAERELLRHRFYRQSAGSVSIATSISSKQHPRLSPFCAGGICGKSGYA